MNSNVICFSTEHRQFLLDFNNNVIYHTFYKKDVSSKYTVLKRSALSETVKKDTCFMEAIRRILNISDTLPWDETVYHLNRFSRTMQISGYSERER